MSFDKLPNEILFIIFDSCDTCDIIRLNNVCKRFYDITSQILKERSKHLLVTSQASDKFRKRCQTILSSDKSKSAMHDMWTYGKYEREIICPKSHQLTSTRGYCPIVYEFGSYRNIKMTKDTIWLAYHSSCYAFDRTKDYSLCYNDWIIYEQPRLFEIGKEILKMILCNDVIITSHQNGSIKQWTIDESLNKKKYFNKKLLRLIPSDSNLQVHVMDATSKNIIASSSDRKIRIWKYISQENAIAEENIISEPKLDSFDLPSVVFDTTGTKFAACHYLTDSIRYIIYDINKCCAEKYKEIEDDNQFKQQAQLLWEDLNTIILLRHKKILGLDVRTHQVVRTWCIPTDDIESDVKVNLTCMSSDNQYAIMTGTSNGAVILWDKRKNNFIQEYQILDDKNNDNYIHSLEFDSTQMYIAANSIHKFDFTRYPGRTRTRSSILVS